MPNDPVEQALLESILSRIREGFVEGIRREVERCRRLGLPLYVARNGTVDVIAPNDASHTGLAG